MIDASKSRDDTSGRTYFAYGPQTANLMEVFLSMMLAQGVALKEGQWPQIWRWTPLSLGTSRGTEVAKQVATGG